MRRRSAASSTQSWPNSIRFPRSTDTVPEIPSTFPQTAPSSTPRSRRCCSAEIILGGDGDHEHSSYRNGREAADVGRAPRAIGAIEPSRHRSRGQPLRRNRRFRCADLVGVLYLWRALGDATDIIAGLFHSLPVHGRARDRHKTAFRSRALNLALRSSLFIRDRTAYEYYCLFHWDHHRFTRRIRIRIRNCWSPMPPRIRNSRRLPVFGRSPSG